MQYYPASYYIAFDYIVHTLCSMRMSLTMLLDRVIVVYVLYDTALYSDILRPTISYLTVLYPSCIL